MYRTGDRVVYTASKHSTHPGRRAEAVSPERNGEGYSYAVKKFWRVAGVHADGTLTLVTRRGKQRVLPASDPQLRLAHWWENFFFRSRFPQLPASPGGDSSSPSTSNQVSANAS